MKYRIIKKYGLYYPQRKLLWWWTEVEDPNYGYCSESDALDSIQNHNKLFGKDSGKEDVVWSGELK